MTSVFPDWGLNEIIAGLKRHRYEGLEPRIGWDHAAGIEASTSAGRRAEIRRQLEGEGLAVCCVATGAKFASPEPDGRRAAVEETLSAIDLAADLGASFVRTFGGPRGDGELHFIVERTAEAYTEVMDRAAERGVTVLMETHDAWCVSSQVREVVRRVDHPRLRVLWDVMHPQRMFETAEESFGVIGGLTEHVHVHDGRFADGKILTVPLGEGVIDHRGPLQLLQRAGFDGYVSVEVIHKPRTAHDAEEVLRQYAEGLRGLLADVQPEFSPGAKV